MNRTIEQSDQRPWYREPWPWVIISIPLAAVIMGFITLYLALANPDYLVVEKDQYQSISSELRAQSLENPEAAQRADDDGEH